VKKILQIEYRESILLTRENILRSEGFTVDSILGTDPNWKSRLSKSDDYGVVVIGYGASWFDRRDLIAFFCAFFPKVPLVALLRRTEQPFHDASHNTQADDPVLWLKTIRKALQLEIPANK
jgi:hypothetical protein